MERVFWMIEAFSRDGHQPHQSGRYRWRSASTPGLANGRRRQNALSSGNLGASTCIIPATWALANALAGLQAGITRFDASLGGIGGCPFVPGATGNISTEDLVHMLHEMGIATGIDLDVLLAESQKLSAIVGHELASQSPEPAHRAGCITSRGRRLPAPARSKEEVLQPN